MSPCRGRCFFLCLHLMPQVRLEEEPDCEYRVEGTSVEEAQLSHGLTGPKKSCSGGTSHGGFF